MADIKDSVGEQGTNKVHDIALVQAMLRLVKDAKNQPYLGGNYDGSYGKVTKAAIISFQNDHKLAAAKAGPGQDTLGLVSSGGPTILKLNAMLSAENKEIRILPDTRTVYWPGNEADAKESSKAILGNVEMEVTFRTTVAKLVDTMFQDHKIVLSLTNSGARRTFQKQYELVTQPNPPTKAGPGESNHNYGMAVDIGFKGLKWMQGNGTAKVAECPRGRVSSEGGGDVEGAECGGSRSTQVAPQRAQGRLDSSAALQRRECEHAPVIGRAHEQRGEDAVEALQ